MARIMERIFGTLASTAPASVLTVPAGKKYEVLLAAFGPNPGVSFKAMVLTTPAAGANRYIDWHEVSSPVGATAFNFNALCLLAGDILQLRYIPASGSVSCNWHLTYMDVDT